MAVDGEVLMWLLYAAIAASIFMPIMIWFGIVSATRSLRRMAAAFESHARAAHVMTEAVQAIAWPNEPPEMTFDHTTRDVAPPARPPPRPKAKWTSKDAMVFTGALCGLLLFLWTMYLFA